MATRSELQALLGDILDSTSPIVQGQTRGGADGSETWVTVTNGDRVRAICFGQVTPGTCGVIQDKSGQWWAIAQGQGSTQTESVQFYRHRKPPEKPKEEADVAVLLCCEKDDAYDFWITWLGDRRKNRFAFVGELPKRLQTEQYWAWEGEGFQFNPYMGATGGGLGASTTPNNYDGAVIEAGPQGAYYESEGRGGPGGNEGGIVTPKWSRVLTDYEIEARVYMQTLCSPIGQYYDVSWEWSDGYEDYNFLKAPGLTRPTVSRGESKSRTRWNVLVGGSPLVTLYQVPPPRILTYVYDPDNEATNPHRVTPSWSPGFIAEGPPVVEDEQKPKDFDPSVVPYVRACWGEAGVDGLDLSGISSFDPSELPSFYLVGNENFNTWHWIWPSIGQGEQGVEIANNILVGHLGCAKYQIISGAYSSPSLEIAFKKNNEDFDPNEYRQCINGQCSDWLPTPPPPPSIEPIKPDGEDPPKTYYLEVYDVSDIQVASLSSNSPISASTEKEEEIAVWVDVKQGKEYLAKEAQTRVFWIKSGDNASTVKSSVSKVEAVIKGSVEVNEETIKEVELRGAEGQAIQDSPGYAEATKPYRDQSGKVVYPCFPQKTQYPPESKKKKFYADKGFSVYHITRYEPEGEGGNVVDWEPFDFNNPELSGNLPSPSINYLYSLLSTDLWVTYDTQGFISWGKDIPEENTRLEEEKESGVDKYGVVYALVKGFIYALYGPTKVSQSTTSAVISKKDGQTLLGNYDFTLFSFRNRMRKPRLYVLDADKSDEGRPFEENDIQDPDQRGLSLLPLTMSQTFRQQLWGYSLSPIGNENNEDWATERVTFERNPSGGDTPFEREYLNDETANSSTVKQRGDNTVDITVKIADVRALLKKTERGDVEFTIHDSQRPSETTIKTFKMNPIQDVFDGYDDVKVLAVAGVIY